MWPAWWQSRWPAPIHTNWPALDHSSTKDVKYRQGYSFWRAWQALRVRLQDFHDMQRKPQDTAVYLRLGLLALLVGRKESEIARNDNSKLCTEDPSSLRWASHLCPTGDINPESDTSWPPLTALRAGGCIQPWFIPEVPLTSGEACLCKSQAKFKRQVEFVLIPYEPNAMSFLARAAKLKERSSPNKLWLLFLRWWKHQNESEVSFWQGLPSVHTNGSSSDGIWPCVRCSEVHNVPNASAMTVKYTDHLVLMFLSKRTSSMVMEWT